MGTFEKLGILVIVVIIVMILAVAIYQWGGAGSPPSGTVTEVPPATSELTVTTLGQLMEEDARARQTPTPDGAAAGTWPGGIPQRYTILKDDKVWVLVVKRWGLKDSFIQQIVDANPKIDFKRMRPGTEIVVPDPSRFIRSASDPAPLPVPAKAGSIRRYEVQGGDTLESIAYRHLGSKTRWPDIVSLNPGLEPKKLFEGQEIYLPVK